MRVQILLVALISTVLAEGDNVQRSARAPQGQIKYSDANGMRVNWKFFAPQNQWRTHLESSQRAQRQEPSGAQAHQPEQPQSQAVHPQPQAIAQAEPNQQYQKPFSAVPEHMKQLILQTYEPQAPYVDPSAFIYNANFAAPPQYEHQLATAEASGPQYEPSLSPYQQKLQTRRDYAVKGQQQGKIEYKEDYDQQQQVEHQRVHHISVPIETMPSPPPPTLLLDKNMPTQIQQLLQYQAQIPYDVIANRIIYKPKSLFIPKQFAGEGREQYRYRSKIYYVKNDDYQPTYETSKPVEEDQRH